jgi:hypothetical protein
MHIRAFVFFKHFSPGYTIGPPLNNGKGRDELGKEKGRVGWEGKGRGERRKGRKNGKRTGSSSVNSYKRHH